MTTAAGSGSHDVQDLTTAARSWATPRVEVLGVGISVIDMPAALRLIEQWIARGAQEYVCVTGVHGVMESQRDPRLRDIHNRSGMTTPDGMPLVWTGRAAGARSMDRVCGPDLMPAVCELARAKGYSSFFYGGQPGVAGRLAQRLQRRYPGLRVAGTFAPPFRALSGDEDARIVELINDAAPDLLWVGLGTPKQERWMAEHLGKVNAHVMIGIGAAFDIHAGLFPQAPRWIQRSGMEWAFRLAHEPRRLWRRYLRNNPAFLARLAARPPRLIVPARPAHELSTAEGYGNH